MWKTNNWSVRVAVITAAIVATSATTQALAQRDAGAKMRGEIGRGYWSNQRAMRSLRHARDYASDIYVYSRDANKVQPETAQAESTKLGRNIESAQKEIENVRKEFATDKDVLASLSIVQDHLTKAAAEHKKLHGECQKESVDGTVGMECCNVITMELDLALAEHAALMRKLEILANRKQSEEEAPNR